jgi:hypothetical protein
MAGELGYDTGPYVNAALFCERALQEADGVLSIMRVIDTINVQAQGPEAPSELPEGGILVNPTLVISLKPGQAHGSQAVRIDMEAPDGHVITISELGLNFAGASNIGQNIVAPCQMQVVAGLYWAHIYVNDRVVTRVPLQINYRYQR